MTQEENKKEEKKKKNPPSKLTLEEKKRQDLIELVKMAKILQKEKEKDGRL